jgi:heat shock protein HtpX
MVKGRHLSVCLKADVSVRHTPAVSSLTDVPTSWLHRAEQRLADGLARRQLASVTARTSAGSRPRRSRATAQLVVLAAVAPVHLTLLASAVGGALLVVNGPTWPLKSLGVILAFVAFATSPRPAKLPRHSVALGPDDAPYLFALLGDVASATGARVPDQVLVTREYNAFAMRAGWRRRRVIAIGAPLWVAAPPQARVALLGHELGHFAHGDLTDLWWVWAAQRSLQHWAEIVRGPRQVLYARNSFAVRYALVPFQLVVSAYQWLINTLNGPAQQRAEYLADVGAARAAGSAGAARMLEVLLVEPTVSTAMTRAAVSPGRPDMWEVVTTSVGAFDDDAFRRNRAGALSTTARIDDSHPATLLRLQLIETLPPMSAAVVLDASRRAAVDAELARPLAIAAAHAGERIRYRR